MVRLLGYNKETKTAPVRWLEPSKSITATNYDGARNRELAAATTLLVHLQYRFREPRQAPPT